MKSLVIERSNWMRGGLIGTALWNKRINSGCCLGHYLNKIDNISLDVLDDVGEPQHLEIECSLVERKINEDGYYGGLVDTSFAIEAMEINDYTDYPREKVREDRLIAHFKGIDIDLSFVD